MDKQWRGIQVIRIRLGVTVLIYGVAKVMSLEDTSAFLAGIDLPGLFVYGVVTIKLIGGLFMIVGLLIPLVLVRFIVVLVGAISSFDLANGFNGYEYELFLVVASSTILVSYVDKRYLTSELYS